MNRAVIEYLGKLGYDRIPNDYYSYIKLWEQYWKNQVEYKEYYDFYGIKREMYTLGMAKTVSEDWSSVIWSEEDEVTAAVTKEDGQLSSDEEEIKDTNDFIFKLTEDYDLENKIPEAIEDACWSGTAGAIIRLKNVEISENGTINTNEKSSRELITVSAKNIIPLRIEHGQIVDVAFVSETTVNKQECYYLEIHLLKDSGYEISNVYLNKNTGDKVENEDVIETIYTLSDDPWFSLLIVPKKNPIKNNYGLGFSVYGNALDQIKACDVVYNNFVMDFYLGGKKIIYNKKLIKYETVVTKDANGNDVIEEYPIYPDDISKQQFMEIGDGTTSENDKELIHEYNPDLRVEENKAGIEMALNTLSPKVMLGTKYYEFSNGKVTTATEYVGDRQDFVKNAKKFRGRLNKFIKGIIKASLYIENVVFGNPVDTECEILVGSTDGFMVDQETERNQARQDLSIGVISKVEYRMKVFHETEEEARKAIEEVNKQYELTEEDF